MASHSSGGEAIALIGGYVVLPVQNDDGSEDATMVGFWQIKEQVLSGVYQQHAAARLVEEWLQFQMTRQLQVKQCPIMMQRTTMSHLAIRPLVVGRLPW
jgi:hypothetical protein